ncbi:hybrid sensor histidine kinase/response regulator [Streptoverticillium reticulum]|uniref:ATP-binding response regulator n=1 Tax=Streptoverticillium reticulum TaxID=1433415 RepID=UPI0039BFB507
MRVLVVEDEEFIANMTAAGLRRAGIAVDAAHELRTPLAVQRVGLEVGLLDADPQQVAEIRSVLLDAADRIERLLAGLLLLSTSEQGLDHSEPVDLHTVVREVVADSAEDASAAQVAVDARLDAMTVDGDGVLLDRLVRNLVSNAIRYNTRPGRVEIRLGRDSGEGGRERAVLEVGNTGPAVPADVVPHLFEPFRRLRPRQHAPGEGNGLGLSIAASIATAHRGTITAEPRPRGGLTVRVVLPLLPLLSSAGEYRPSSADAGATSCKDRDPVRRP